MTVTEAIEYLEKIKEAKGNIGIPPSLQEPLNEFIRKTFRKNDMKF